MTEKLMQLLHDEATRVDVPPPAADLVVRRGRALRRRRRALTGAAALVTVALVGAGGVLAVDSMRDEHVVTYSTETYQKEGALAVDSRLYVAGERIPFDEAVKSFLYTSIGTVVRSGTSPWTDDADVDHYTLVRPDGSRKSVDLTTNDRVVATEPDSTHLAYADPHGERWDLVVMDLDSGEELARATIDGSFTWGGWEAPPVALDGDLVWAHFDDGWTERNWRTGKTRDVPGTGQVYEIANGNYAVNDRGTWTIRSMQTGDVLRRLELPRQMYGMFSPDGRYLKFFDQNQGMDGRAIDSFAYDVENGLRTPLPKKAAWDFGWTPSGDLLSIFDGEVVTCRVIIGTCEPTGLVVDVGKNSTIKLGGNPYES